MSRNGLKAILCASFLVGCAELPVAPVEERQLVQVHEIGLSKDQIFDKALEWMAQAFVDSKAVIELKDRENGKIIGKGITKFTSMGLAAIPCRYTLVIEIKDGKYRTTYKDFIAMWGENEDRPEPVTAKPHLDQVRSDLTKLDQSLVEYLTIKNKTQDW